MEGYFKYTTRLISLKVRIHSSVLYDAIYVCCVWVLISLIIDIIIIIIIEKSG